MGNILKVLISMNRYEDCTAKEIHDELINYSLIEEGFAQFDYFSLWDDGNDSFLGKDDPERLIREVSEWNAEITNELKHELAEIMQHGFTTPEEVIEYFDNHPFAAYSLSTALKTFDDSFSYGDKLLFDKYGEYHTRIPDQMLEDIIENPAEYAIIEVIYH